MIIYNARGDDVYINTTNANFEFSRDISIHNEFNGLLSLLQSYSILLSDIIYYIIQWACIC